MCNAEHTFEWIKFQSADIDIQFCQFRSLSSDGANSFAQNMTYFHFSRFQLRNLRFQFIITQLNVEDLPLPNYMDLPMSTSFSSCNTSMRNSHDVKLLKAFMSESLLEICLVFIAAFTKFKHSRKMSANAFYFIRVQVTWNGWNWSRSTENELNERKKSMGISWEKYANNDDNVVGSFDSLTHPLSIRLDKHGVVCQKRCVKKMLLKKINTEDTHPQPTKGN